MSNNFITTTHPKNGYDVTLKFDEDRRFVGAVYDDGEDVEITEVIKSHFQSDIDRFVRNYVASAQESRP